MEHRANLSACLRRLRLLRRLSAAPFSTGFSLQLRYLLQGDNRQRNFAIHGNVAPEREQIETVYFEGKRPLFANGGDNILKLFDHLEAINSPHEVISDYENVHLFLAEIIDRLTDQHRHFFDQVINDSYPGYEVYKKRVTKILPNHTMRAMIPDIKYDDELDLNW